MLAKLQHSFLQQVASSKPATICGPSWDPSLRVWVDHNFHPCGNILFLNAIGGADPEALAQAIGVLK